MDFAVAKFVSRSLLAGVLDTICDKILELTVQMDPVINTGIEPFQFRIYCGIQKFGSLAFTSRLRNKYGAGVKPPPSSDPQVGL